MSRALKIESIVPGPRLCQKLPKEIFSKSIFMWYRSPATQNKWRFCARLSGYKYPWINWVPAPTVEEFIEALGGSTDMSDDKSYNPPATRFSAQNFNVGIRSAYGQGKNLVTALCNCYLQKLEKEKK